MEFNWSVLRSSRRHGAVKSSDARLLSRREFNERCVALGSLATLSGASTLDAATAAATTGTARTVKFREGTIVPAVGQGSGNIGQGRHPAADEEEALRTGLSLGMTLIDTSGNYGKGRSEELIKRVIAGQRDRAFVVSKVEANDVTGDAMARACEASLTRLGTDHLDLYLLHWPTANTDAIPESGSVAHVKENAVALSLTLTPGELQTLDAAHPRSDH